MASYDEYLKQLENDAENKAKLDKAKSTINATADSQKKTITDNYTQTIKDGKAEYEDDYRENAVQKKVNEFYISEEMANMGLTNSGLNRTQMTATQLSYANNKAEIDRQRQSMVDSLTREMTGKLTEVENNRITSIQEAEDNWNTNNESMAYNLYTKDLETETERLKAEMEAETARINAYYGSLSNQSDEDEPIGTIISTKYYNGEIAENVGRFGYMGKDNNGVAYQPRGVYITDKNGDKMAYKLMESGYTAGDWFGEDAQNTSGVNIAKQKVWEANGKYFIWNGTKNRYEEVPEQAPMKK